MHWVPPLCLRLLQGLGAQREPKLLFSWSLHPSWHNLQNFCWFSFCDGQFTIVRDSGCIISALQSALLGLGSNAIFYLERCFVLFCLFGGPVIVLNFLQTNLLKTRNQNLLPSSIYRCRKWLTHRFRTCCGVNSDQQESNSAGWSRALAPTLRGWPPSPGHSHTGQYFVCLSLLALVFSYDQF